MNPRQALNASVFLFLTLFIVLFFSGAGLAAATALSAIVLVQSFSGAVIWQLIRPHAPPLEHAGASLAVGTVLAALMGTATATLGIGAWGWIIPSLVGISFVVVRHKSLTSRVSQSWGGTSLIGFFAALVPGMLIILGALRNYPLGIDSHLGRYHPDMPFFEAISVDLANYGAFSTPFLTEGALRYHWLTYSWVGQLTVESNAEPFVALTRILPTVALLGSASLVASWTQQLSRQKWSPTLAGLLLSLGGFSGAVFGGVLTMDSPSQSMAVLWLIAFSLLAVHVTQTQTTSWPAIILAGVFMFAMVGGKVSAAAPAFAGVIVLSVVQAVRGQRKIVALPLAVAIGAFSGFTFFLAGSLGGGGLMLGTLVDRASSQQGLNPTDSRHAVALGTAILVLAVLPRWAGVWWLFTQRSWRWRPEVTYSLGLVASSLAALLAFNSFNEIWFSSAISGPLSVITATGAGDAFTKFAKSARLAPRLLGSLLSVIAFLTFLLVWLLWATGASGGNIWVSTWRWLGPVAAWITCFAASVLILYVFRRKRPSAPKIIAGATVLLVLLSIPGRLLGFGTDQVGVLNNGLRNEWFSFGQVRYIVTRDSEIASGWTESQWQAATWLRANSTPTAIVGTNITLAPLVSSLTHRPTYVSGILYQSPYGYPWMSPLLLDNESTVWSFIDNPEVSTFRKLCSANVRWLWIDLKRTSSNTWEPFYTVRFASKDTVIAQLKGDTCSMGPRM